MEDIAFGERVRKYVIEGFNGKEWNILANGTAIGHKKIEQICETEVSSIRFTATRSAQLPKIRSLSVYYSELPFVDGITDYPKEDFLKVHQWGEEMFYGNDLLEHEIVVDLSGILTEVQDVGQYLVQLKDQTGDVRILEANLKIDGQLQPDYIRLQSDSSLTMYIPGVDTFLHLQLVVALPGLDSQGIVLIKKL
jgi:hypothetical protein